MTLESMIASNLESLRVCLLVRRRKLPSILLYCGYHTKPRALSKMYLPRRYLLLLKVKMKERQLLKPTGSSMTLISRCDYALTLMTF